MSTLACFTIISVALCQGSQPKGDVGVAARLQWSAWQACSCSVHRCWLPELLASDGPPVGTNRCACPKRSRLTGWASPCILAFSIECDAVLQGHLAHQAGFVRLAWTGGVVTPSLHWQPCRAALSQAACMPALVCWQACSWVVQLRWLPEALLVEGRTGGLVRTVVSECSAA